MIETDVEISRLEDIARNDVVVLDHVEMKHIQLESKNAKMCMEATSGVQKIKQLKAEEFKLKQILRELEQKYKDLVTLTTTTDVDAGSRNE